MNFEEVAKDAVAERRRLERAKREALCGDIDVSHQKELMDNFEADF